MSRERGVDSTSAGVRMPRMIFRTAWREGDPDIGPPSNPAEDLQERTKALVLRGFQAGARGIDTAFAAHRPNCEPGIGAALASLFASGVARDSLFVQIKVHLDYNA